MTLITLLLACTDTASPPEAPADPIDPARYQADLEALAVPRRPGSAGWEAAQAYCADRFESLGYEVTLHDYGTGVNVIGRKAGSASTGTVVLSAHYDSVQGCTGADDNASGVAGLLEAARLLAPQSFEHDLVVACWDEEERGLIGSEAWASEAAANGETIQVAFSLEMIGYRSDEEGSQELPGGLDILFPDELAEVEANGYRGDFVAVIGDESARAAVDAYEQAAAERGLPEVSLVLATELTGNILVGDLRRSDHASFWDAGFPGIMLTDTANFRNTAYHCANGEDSVDRLDATFATDITASLVTASETLLGR